MNDLAGTGLHLFEGLFKVLALEHSGKIADPFNIRWAHD